MDSEPTAIIHARISQSIFAEICSEINGSKRSLSDWLKEAVDEKLLSENKDKLEREIAIKEEELQILKKKKELFREKEKDIQKISDTEISFLLETKRVVEQDFTFIKGRINLYRNKFGKAYKISEQEFMQLLNSAYEQYLEMKAQKQLTEELQR